MRGIILPEGARSRRILYVTRNIFYLETYLPCASWRSIDRSMPDIHLFKLIVRLLNAYGGIASTLTR